MGRDILDIDTSSGHYFDLRALHLQDLEAVRIILTGESVIDWHKLDMPDRDHVDRFLRAHGLKPGDPEDQERLRFVLNQAINYLEEHHAVRFPDDLRDPEDVRDVFVAASTWTGRFRRRQMLACMVLKLMHTINHMEAADLKHRAPISEADLIDRAERTIIDFADRMRTEGYPLVAFYGSRKTRTSVISKLLSKRESIAATIFDKLRFRIVVERKSQLIPVMAHLTRELFPVNYVVPGESQNNLLDLREAVKGDAHTAELGAQMQRLDDDGAEDEASNPFSGDGYRMIDFIVDFPVRVDDVVERMHVGSPYMLGRTVYVMVEFQVVDRETERLNEIGDNAHTLYKARQKKRVEGRLRRGGLKKKE